MNKILPYYELQNLDDRTELQFEIKDIKIKIGGKFEFVEQMS